MKRRQCWRYTCDFCKKSNCSASSIKQHELHCTMNPNRVCRMCARVGDKQAPMPDLIAAIRYAAVPGFEEYKVEDLGGDFGKIGVPPMKVQKIDALRTVAHNCPACILAAMRQASEPDDGVFVSDNGWNWKTEKTAWIEDYRNSVITDESSDGSFDRQEWDEYRAKRYPIPTPTP